MPTPLKLLIAEDNPRDAELVLRELRQADFEPVWQRVDNEADYLGRLQTDLDLIISDYVMPQFSGLRALELLKQSGLDVPFIVVSGTIGEETAVEAMRLGAVDYLLKDRLARLGQAVNHALEQSRLRRERRLAEEQLHLQGVALETTANAIVITDRNGTFLWVNPAFHALTGYSRAEIIGQNPRLLKSGRHDQAFYRELWRTLLAGHTWRGEFINRRKDGSHYHGEQTLTPVRGADGTITHFVGVMTDVTARKQAEEKLRETDAHLHQLVARSPTVIYSLKMAGEEGVSDYFSPNATELTGYTEEEMRVPGWWRDHLHPDDGKSALACLRQAIEQGSSRAEYRVKHKNGAYYWVEDRKRALPGASGRPPGIVGGWTDITTRKAAEDALRASEDRFRRLIENVSDVITLLGEGGIMRYQSPSLLRVLGYPVEEMTDRQIEEFIHPEDLAKVRESIRQVLADPETPAPLEFRIRHRDESWRIFQSLSKGMTGPAGEKLIVVNARDITDSRRLEEQFLRTQRMEAVGTLASGVAHDLNNVLAPMLMGAALLKMRDTATPKDIELLTMIEQCGQRGAGIIRQLLSFSRGLPGERVSLQPKHLLHDMAGIMSETFPRNIAIVESVPPDLWLVEADPTQLHQVIMNLCVNARDAMPEGGKLTLSAKNALLSEEEVRPHADAKAGPHVMVTITDTGQGIPPEVVPRIFEPFFTTKGVGKGTGLGLSTAAGIVKSHGGFMTVYSQPGWGTVFKVHLPATPEATAAETGADARPVQLGNNETILIVDDEEPIRAMLRLVLEAHNYRVLEAGSGEEAIKLFIQHAGIVRLVLTDMMMPGIDGLALVRALRVMNSGIRVIACSGLDQSDRQAEFAAQGVNEVLAKPFTPALLMETLGRALLEKH